MNRGTIVFSMAGSDDEIARFPFSAALFNLARVKLTRAGNTFPLEKGNADTFGSYVVYLAAGMAHIKGLPEIKPEDVTQERMLEFECVFNYTLEGFEEANQEPGKQQAEVDENPTVTPPASS